MLRPSVEDYIKAIYKLQQRSRRVTTKSIATELGVRMASVTGMIKHLDAEGYLAHTPYHGVSLTPEGTHVALMTLRRHRLVELFLVKTLQLGWDEVHADAERLEHALSDRLVERIYEFLGRPQFDPHGAPIPASDGAIVPREGVALDQMEAGSSGRVLRVGDDDSEFLRYLTRLKVRIGSSVRVLQREPYGGPISVLFGRQRADLGVEAARRIIVQQNRS